MKFKTFDKKKSIKKRKIIIIRDRYKTTYVDPLNSSQFGHETLLISKFTSVINWRNRLTIIYFQNSKPFFKVINIEITRNYAGETGLEPATYGFGGRCSTN